MPDLTVTPQVTFRWYCGCSGCGHYGFTHTRDCPSAEFVIRLAWLCPRCDTYNAPHRDQCACSSAFQAP